MGNPLTGRELQELYMMDPATRPVVEIDAQAYISTYGRYALGAAATAPDGKFLNAWETREIGETFPVRQNGNISDMTRKIFATKKMVTPESNLIPIDYHMYVNEYEVVVREFKKNEEAYQSFLEGCETKKLSMDGDKEASEKIGTFNLTRDVLSELLSQRVPYGSAFSENVLEKLLRDHGIPVNWGLIKDYDD